MNTTWLKPIIFLLFFLHLIPAYANCEFCKRESCKCTNLFKEIICHLEGKRRTPENTQLPHAASGGMLGVGLAAGLAGLSISNTGGSIQPLMLGSSPFQFNAATNKVPLCQAMSPAKMSENIQACRDILKYVQKFITMLELMSNGNEQTSDTSADWLATFYFAQAYSTTASNDTNLWIHLENGSWLFIVITTESDIAVLEWGQGVAAPSPHSINSFKTREQALIFIAGKVEQSNCSSSGVFRKVN